MLGNIRKYARKCTELCPGVGREQLVETNIVWKCADFQFCRAHFIYYARFGTESVLPLKLERNTLTALTTDYCPDGQLITVIKTSFSKK